MIFKLFESFLFGPYLLVLVTGLIAFFVFKKSKPSRGLSVCLGILVIHVLGVSNLFVTVVSLPLRSWVPENSMKNADAIVVHGSSAHRIGAPTSGSSERGYLGAEAFLKGRAPLLLVMGYSPTDSLGSAKAMRIIAQGMDVPQSKILIAGGRTTYEEAQIGAPLLRKRGIKSIILVSSWYHMPRVQAVWRAQGFDVITHTYLPKLDLWGDFLDWRNLQKLRWVCHEYAGFLVYRLRGWA